MTRRQSAGILLYRKKLETPEIFLVHPGGPFWKNKDREAWSIPKGEFADGEDPLTAAKREFYEETGYEISGKFVALNSILLKSGKKVFAWAINKDIDLKNIISNHFEMEWPPRSGKLQSFPEVDKGEWFSFEIAKEKINGRQVELIEQLQQMLEEGIM